MHITCKVICVGSSKLGTGIKESAIIELLCCFLHIHKAIRSLSEQDAIIEFPFVRANLISEIIPMVTDVDHQSHAK